jgi:tetratricopeptide (TPR) repeat protein
MSRPRKKRVAPPNKPKANPPSRPESPKKSGVAPWKRWCFRLLALVAVPAFCFGLVELGLRLAGFGYPTAFLLPDARGGKTFFVQNNQFGWRFFGSQMARAPYPISIPQTKAPGTVRIFVFGESAAFGDPLPRFGLPRLLEAILSLRHPGVRFEVVNTAMTGINSHTILPIARACAGADGDLWVVYMGNNEVVGPFGAGTVFGPQVPPLPLIRGSLALKSTRTGQLLDSWRQRLQKPPPEKSEWGGMMMFMDHQVPADDPRMNAVYHHFERNLADLIRAGQRSGAAVVVSTVAVNLKDCAPFGSAHRTGLSAADKTNWEQLYQRGIDAEATGKIPEAAERFGEAARIDDRVAELRFRQGRCALQLGDPTRAQQQFRAARDLDTLRFRCDSRLNELTRQIAANRESERVVLVDAEQVFAEQSREGSPGDDLFYEHVHLTFEGNYLLARTIAAQAEMLLPENTVARVAADRPWPTAADCARRLAWSDWNWRAAASEILVRLQDPPFTGQLNHDAEMRRLGALVERLAPATQPAGIREAQNICAAAVAAVPDDAALQAQLAALKQSAGDLDGAASAARRTVELLPSSSDGWMQLGAILAQQEHFEEAAEAFRQTFELDPQNVWALQNLAQSFAKLGRRDDAIREYRRALALKPRFGPAWLGLGQVLEEMGRTAEAEDCYRQALVNRIHRAVELTTLARFCQSRGWFEAAVTNYADAIRLNPSDARLHIEAGQNLTALGRRAEAGAHYAEAVRLAPDSEPARFLYGLELGREGKTSEAAEQFREAVRLMPELPEARLNLGVALMNQGSNAAALTQFEEVLRRSPTNTLAIKYIQALRARPAPGQTP